MKKNILRIILIICLIGVFYLIFQFSSQDGDKSRGTSQGFISSIIDVIYKNIDIKEKTNVIENIDVFVRKMAHFTIYMVVGILSMLLVNTYNLNKNKKIVISTLIGCVYAITDEIHQYFVPERSAEVADVLLDTFRCICRCNNCFKYYKNNKRH